MVMVAVGSDLFNLRPETGAIEQAWRRIAPLRLRLRASLDFFQHRYRGEPWLIIADQRDERYFRCSDDAEPFLRLLDGSRSVEQAWHEARQSHAVVLLRLDIMQLVANLKASDLLLDDSLPDTCATELPARRRPKANSWLRPFAIRFALLDPDRLLDKAAPRLRPLFTRTAGLFWLALVMIALTVAWLHWPQLLEHSQTRFADPKNLLWYWLLYPLIKLLHELGHASATKVWGGAVHEMGIMLLVFFPVPYVDSSAAHAFSSKNRRLLVSAAGIMVELFLASLALLVWVNTGPGMLHDLAFDTVVIGGVSTLLFNANPLLRYDGYYILGELIEIPNLGTRSMQYLGYLFKRHVLDMPAMRSPVTASGERKWLFGYGVCSAAYRVFISLFIALWVAGKFFVIGVALALWAITAQIVYPAVRNVYLLIPVAQKAGRLKRLGVTVSILLLVVAGVLLAPVGQSTYAEGLVNLPENALIRAGADGIVTRVLQSDGERVEAGATILQLENLELATRRDILLARLEETSARQKDVLLQDRTQAEILKVKASAIAAEIRDIQAQIKSLEVTSATGGVVCLPMQSDLPGRFVSRGDVIGYVADTSQITARVVVNQADIDAVRRRTGLIEARMSSRPGSTLSARFLRELPQATDRLPSRLLGSGAGGDIAVDTRDQAGVQTISNIFQVEIALPIDTLGNYLGQRIYVRFIHERESMASRLLRRLDRFMLQAPFMLSETAVEPAERAV